MKLKSAKEGFFLYENKNTQEIIVIPISMNEKNTKIIEDTFTWMCEVWDNFKEGDLLQLPLPYHHNVSWQPTKFEYQYRIALIAASYRESSICQTYTHVF